MQANSVFSLRMVSHCWNISETIKAISITECVVVVIRWNMWSLPTEIGWGEVRLTCIEVKENLLPPFTLKLDVAGSSEMFVSKIGMHKSRAPFRLPDVQLRLIYEPSVCNLLLVTLRSQRNTRIRRPLDVCRICALLIKINVNGSVKFQKNWNGLEMSTRPMKKGETEFLNESVDKPCLILK